MNTTLSQEVIDDVLYEWQRLKRSPYKVADAVGISARTVLEIIDEHGHKVSQIQERHEGWGRPELRDFLVARTKAGTSWDNDEPEIAEARRAYEAGTVELCTGRDGRYLLLYAFPRKRKEPRPGYFVPEPSL